MARDPNTPGPVMIVSCWHPTDAELAAIIETGEIYVAVMAHPEHRTQPPISLHGCNPFEYANGHAYQVAPRTYEEELISDADILEVKVRAIVEAELDPYEAPELRFAEVPLIQKIVQKIADEKQAAPIDREDMDAIHAAAKKQIQETKARGEELDRSGLLEASGLKDVVKPRTFTEEVTGKRLAD